MNNKITRSCQCAFRAEEKDDEKWIEGYFAVYNETYEIFDGMTESIAPGAFDKYLDRDIRVLINHNSTLVLGRTKAETATVTSDDHGVYVRCKVNPDDSDAVNVYARLKRGDVSQASFGGYIVKESREVTSKGTHYTLDEIEPFEFSVCTFPAYETTDVSARDRQDNEKIYNKRWKAEMKERLAKWH